MQTKTLTQEKLEAIASILHDDDSNAANDCDHMSVRRTIEDVFSVDWEDWEESSETDNAQDLQHVKAKLMEHIRVAQAIVDVIG